MNSSILLETPQSETKQIHDRLTIVKKIRKWGETNTDGLLDPNCQFFSDPSIDGVVGYRIELNTAVVLGDPVCSPENKGALACSFHNFCKEKKLGVVYTIVSDSFAHWGCENLSGALIEFGQKFVLNPQSSPLELTGSKAVLLRKKVKHAVKENTSVHEYLDHNPELRQAIEVVAETWLNGRTGPQIYLSHVHLFEDGYGKRWFYALQRERVVGFLVLNQLQANNGWLLNHIMLTKDAPHGTSELLITSTLDILKNENCQFVLIGPVAGKKLGKILGLNPLTSMVVRAIYKGARFLFRLSGSEIYWEKFQPGIQSSYLMFPNGNINLKSISALFRAFNVGS